MLDCFYTKPIFKNFKKTQAKKYFILTYGCQMNESDSERIGFYLEKKAYKPAKSEKQADLVILNICSVRQSAVNRIYSKINKLKTIKTKPKIFITGCVLDKDKKKFKILGASYKKFGQIAMKKDCKHKIGYVPIMRGCNNFCSYCVVPYTRGREFSRSPNTILREVRELLKQGHTEIVLLGQNVNSYLFKKTDFSNLLKLINNISGDFKIRFLTNHPKDMSDKLINTISKCEKIIKEIHLPVQSGDNKILRAMNRKYTKEHYLNLIKKIRKKILNIKFTTDVIVGFPGETKAQFQNTADLVKKVKFTNAYIAKYSPRPETTAFNLDNNISHKEKKRREKILRKIVFKK